MKPASLATVLLRLASLWLIYQTLSGSLAPLILNRMAVQQRFAEVPFLEGVQPMFVTLVLVSLLLAGCFTSGANLSARSSDAGWSRM